MKWLITAANRGLGLEFARQLTAAGESVIATARPDADTSEVEQLDVRLERVDVSDSESVSALVKALGSEPIDVLINNAGFFLKGGALAELDVDSMLEAFNVNSLGALRVTQALLPNLRLGGAKKIVHITSKMGSMSDNGSGGSYAYRMSKAALNMFNTSLAIDLADEGFCCALLHPGWVQTRMGGDGAPITVEESVTGMRKVISELTFEQSGSFFDYAGERISF